MKSCLQIVCLFALFCVVITLGTEEEDIDEKLAIECQKKTNASDADLKILDDDSDLPTTRTQYCLLACYYKGTKIMDENNKITYDKSILELESAKENKETNDKLIIILKECSANTIPDKDECEAAKKYLLCVKKKAKEMGIDL